MVGVFDLANAMQQKKQQGFDPNSPDPTGQDVVLRDPKDLGGQTGLTFMPDQNTNAAAWQAIRSGLSLGNALVADAQTKPLTASSSSSSSGSQFSMANGTNTTDGGALPYMVGSSREHLSPYAAALADYVKKKYGVSVEGYNYRKNTANASQLSEHSRGRAIDIMVPNLAKGQELLNQILAWQRLNGNPARIQYAIFNRRQYGGRSGNWAGRSYGGPNPHTDHIHLELDNPFGPLAPGADRKAANPWY